ncbi:MAG: Uroporphyrinogen-III C-methyltransferase [Planctomycetota bacterium]|jgi:uroporphyrinogen III methyltransferase/synthase
MAITSRTPTAVDAIPDASRVWFVGAGPGHPDLLTLRGLELLRAADTIVHDALVPTLILDLAGPRTIRIPVPRHATDGDPGETTGRLLVELASTGGRIVRLKGGDPSVFGRLAEETAPLRAAGIGFGIVPGVTAVLAAAAAADVPLTSRAAASVLTIVTGHEAEEKTSRVDLEALAALSGTLAVYMGVARAARWAAALVAAGRSSATPVTIVSRCSWPDQRIATATLGTLAQAFTEHQWPAPAVIIVGDVVTPVAPASTGPLAGRRILLTRPSGQADELAAAISSLGGEPLHLPVVRIAPPDSWTALDGAIAEGGMFDWIVFASVNGVRAFVARLRAARRDARILGTARLAAIGSATAAALGEAGLACDLVPAAANSEGMVAALLPTLHAGRVLLVRAARGRDVMRRDLEAAGHEVVEVAAYATRPVETLGEGDVASLDAAPIDWVTITSGAIAEAAVRLFGERMRRWRIGSISPVTSRVLETLGFPPDCEAREASAAGLVEAICRWHDAPSSQLP